MKLSEVVRGVEVKEGYERVAVDTEDAYDDGLIRGYNSLAQAEVVVDEEKLKDIIHTVKELCEVALRDNTLGTNYHYYKDDKHIAQAIATAIESGSIISLKEDV